MRAGSVVASRVSGPCEAACTSRPAVKARGPAPVRRMVRIWGLWERVVKILWRLSHILRVGVRRRVSRGGRRGFVERWILRGDWDLSMFCMVYMLEGWVVKGVRLANVEEEGKLIGVGTNILSMQVCSRRY